MVVDQEIDYDAKIKEMREWWRSNPNLPHKVEEIVLKRFIAATYGKTEYTKQVLELNYEIRQKNPSFFFDRDPLAPETLKINHACDIVPIPQLTPEDGYRVIIYRLRDTNDSKFNFVEAVKLFFMVTDARIGTEPEVPNGDIPVFDMQGFSFKHIAKVLKNFSVLRLYMKFSQEALPVRLKQIHLINVSPIVDKILSFMRPLMRKEVQNALKFHLPGSDTIFDCLPRSLVPLEYGGDGDSFDVLKENMDNMLRTRRDYLMDADFWKATTYKKKDYQIEEVNGNTIDLKNLEID